MNEDLENIPLYFIKDYNYRELFQEKAFYEKEITEEEREGLIKVIDETLSMYISGLPMIYKSLKECNGDGDLNRISKTIYSVSLFVIMTLSDCLVAGKYYLLAKTDYEKRYMRGKLRIVLNEGFKKLYGFTEKQHMISEWGKFRDILQYYPELILRQYNLITMLLEEKSLSSTWWKDERDLEVHMDAEKLYDSRQEEIPDSKVITDTIPLYNALFAVNQFVGNVNGCLVNTLNRMYHEGKLKED